jgi:hypothetical protein
MQFKQYLTGRSRMDHKETSEREPKNLSANLRFYEGKLTVLEQIVKNSGGVLTGPTT